MNRTLRLAIKQSVALLLAVFLCHTAFAQSRKEHAAAASATGILLLAHGGNAMWNEEVSKLASAVDQTAPTEVAFGMATKRNIQAAVDRLVARKVTEIIAVPLFVSSHSSIITSTQYLLGLRQQAPKELALYAKMDHGHGNHHHSAASATETIDPTTPVKTTVPIRMTAALDRHPLVADILFSRAQSISKNPQGEVVIVVAHGPVSTEENNLWLADMRALVERMTKSGGFQRVEYMTVRDDAPEPLRSQATAELRQMVERAMREQKEVLIVPLLVSYGGIEAGVKKRLEGLRYTMCRQALLPDNRLIDWVKLSANLQSPQKP